MPRIARSDSALQEDKERILRTALEIVHSDGFACLSLRKIASRLGMTAPNIYYYFSNKDELNIEMRRFGFAMLYERMCEAYASAETIEKKVRNLMEAYVRFALENPYYYEIMFVLPTPKYLDYVGTALEEISGRELQSSLRVFDLIKQCLAEFTAAGGYIPGDEETTIMILWGELHGILALYNNKMLNYVTAHPDKVIADVTGFLMDLVMRYLKTGPDHAPGKA
jgi:AcrR family transcriptional regulator